MPSISSRVSIRTGSNSRRPSRVRLRMADIRRSILAIDDLMNPNASEKSCESCLSSPSRSVLIAPRLGFGGLMRDGRNDAFDQFAGVDPHRFEFAPPLAGKVEDGWYQAVHLGAPRFAESQC